METPFSHYKSIANFLDLVSGPIWSKFKLVWDFMHVLITCKYKKDRIKNNREKVETSFSPLCQWGLSVAMETRVLIQTAPKPYAAFPPPQWCYTSNLIKIGPLASEIFKFKSVKFSSLKGK